MGGLHCWYMAWSRGKSPHRGPGLDAIEPCCCVAVDFGEGGQGHAKTDECHMY